MTTPMLSTTADLMPLLPELVLIGGAFALLMLDLFHMPIWISLGFIIITLGITAWLSIRHSKKHHQTTL